MFLSGVRLGNAVSLSCIESSVFQVGWWGARFHGTGDGSAATRSDDEQISVMFVDAKSSLR